MGRFVAVVLAAVATFAVLTGIGNAAPWAETGMIEGHTVFVSVGNITDESGKVQFAAAMAVLVREHEQPKPLVRFPGVLWFNDQYLVNPVSPDAGRIKERFPCTGAVLAVETGSPDPRGLTDKLNADSYVESYRITDPNNKEWDIDKWRVDLGDGAPFFVWTVAINNAHGGSTTGDDGTSSCEPITDGGCPLAVGATACNRSGVFEDAESGRAPAATQPGAATCDVERSCRSLRYNALLFFEIKDFERRGPPKDHAPRSTNSTSDAGGCQSGTEWECPGGDDDREGDSHGYLPAALRDPAHGFSADCDGDGRNDKDCHATVEVDVYYGTAPAPILREYKVFDVAGSEVAYGCHVHARACGGSSYGH